MTLERELAAQIGKWLVTLRTPALDPYLAAWPLPVASACKAESPRPAQSCGRARKSAGVAAPLPVLRWIPDLLSGADMASMDIVASLCAAAPTLTWQQTYTVNELGSGFLDNYGWSEVFGVHGPLRSDRIACGFLLLGPSTQYPRHRHEAEEIYFPLSGTAAWLQGDEVWRARPPVTAVYHSSGEIHAMRTGAQPLLALYLWRSANLVQKAQLV